MSTDSTPPRILWRLQGTRRIVIAAIHPHIVGWELRVGFEGRDDDVLHTQVERFDVHVLEQKADEMREALWAKGWIDAPTTTDAPQ